MWRRAEELGFDHAWTYDHLVWGGLPDSPWYGTIPTLTAAAMVTSTIRLGTFVTSPNYRHPVTFMRDLLALDDISGGRMICGIGAGGDIDSAILGGQPLTPRERFERLTEFTELLDRLLTQDHVSHHGTYFSAVDARTLLAKFGLGADQSRRPTSSLSPGERTRAALALLQGRGVNLLVLDEPTNHLDLAAIEQLESALDSFPGTVLLVTHDRQMLATVRTNRRLAVHEGTVTEI